MNEQNQWINSRQGFAERSLCVKAEYTVYMQDVCTVGNINKNMVHKIVQISKNINQSIY